jgi:glycine cleavage system H protein
MSEVPEGLHYTKEHEWIRVDGDEVVIGITDHAQNSLTDIVYVELPEVGLASEVMEEIAIVESVKSASPIFAPLKGVVTAINEALEDTPELINQDPYGEGWMVKMTIDDSNNIPSLLGAAEYKAEIGE